eukprot:467231_1
MPKRASTPTASDLSKQPPSKRRKLQQTEGESSPFAMDTQDFLQSQLPNEYRDEMNKENIDSQSQTPPISGKSKPNHHPKSSKTPSRSHRSGKTPSRKKKSSSHSSSHSSSSMSNPLATKQTAVVSINGVAENIEMSLLRNIGYFHRKLARPSMEIVPDHNQNKTHSKRAKFIGERNKNQKNKSDEAETYKFEFNVTAFDMNHFKMLLKYCNVSEQKDDEMDEPKIMAKTVQDLEQFVYASDYFLVYDVSQADIESCYGQCAVCDSTHELLKKWKKSKLKILSEFASNLQRKLHPLSSKIGVDELIQILDRYIACLDHVDDVIEDEEELIHLRTALQIYWIHYIKGKTYFWNIYSILKKMNEFLSKLRNKMNENKEIVGRKLFDYLPYITLIYSYVDFVNCIQRMKDSTANYILFIDKMNSGIVSLLLLFFEKEKEGSLKEYNVEELKKRWYFRLNDADANNKAIMIELVKTLIWYLMEFHLPDFMIRMFWPIAHYVFLDEEFIRAVIKKCNQMEITQLAEILNGCNVKMYAQNNRQYRFKYNDIITKHCYSSINHNDNIAVLGWR